MYDLEHLKEKLGPVVGPSLVLSGFTLVLMAIIRTNYGMVAGVTWLVFAIGAPVTAAGVLAFRWIPRAKIKTPLLWIAVGLVAMLSLFLPLVG